MGGSFDVNLTTSTTHLVAADTDTEKYRVATAMKVWMEISPARIAIRGCVSYPMVFLLDWRVALFHRFDRLRL